MVRRDPGQIAGFLYGMQRAQGPSAMTRIQHGFSADLEWINVSVRRRCPICGGAAGCKMHAEGSFAACGKQPSDWPMTSGAWLHRLEPAFSRGTAIKEAIAPHSTKDSTKAPAAGAVS
jgi:hypothetical protein